MSDVKQCTGLNEAGLFWAKAAASYYGRKQLNNGEPHRFSLVRSFAAFLFIGVVSLIERS